MKLIADRAGVVVLSRDSLAKAFVDDIVAEVEPVERYCIAVEWARTCIAIVAADLRRRLLIIDGAPPDLTTSALIEAIKMTDPGLPIVFVRRDWDRPPVLHNGVHVLAGPFVSRPVQALLLHLLAATRQ